MALTLRNTTWILVLALPAAQAGEPGAAPMRHGAALRALVFSRDGKYLLTGSQDRTARVWETATGKAVCEPLRHGGVVKAVAFSPDGRTVATGSADGTARLWDAQTGKPVGKVMQHGGEVNSIAFSPDGRYLLTGSDDFKAKLWNAVTGDLVTSLPHPQKITRVAFFPDGRTVVTCCKDMALRKWDVFAAKQLGTIDNKRRYSAFDIACNGHEMLIATHDNGCHLRDVRADQPLTPRLLWQFECVDIGFSWDSRLFFTRTLTRGLGAVRPVQLWETATCKQIGQPLSAVALIAFHPNGRTMASADREGVVRIRNLADQFSGRGPKSAQQLWQDLEGPRATLGFPAVLALAAVPEEALPLLEQHLRAVSATPAEQIGKLIADLADDSYDVREQAEEKLGRAGATAEPLVRTALAKKPPLDAELRLRRLLGTVGTVPDSPERLRAVRGIQVLEIIGTARAQELLRSLAQGAPQLYTSCAAKAALQRLMGEPSGKSR